VTLKLLGGYDWVVGARVGVADGQAVVVLLVTRLDRSVRVCVPCHVNGVPVTTRCVAATDGRRTPGD
jgi:hypothetical protein